MAWLFLLTAGSLEIAWILGLKYSEGFTRLWPSVLTLAAIAASFAMLGLSLKSVPFGTAYAVWGGIGAVCTVIVGILWFHEPASTMRILLILAIVAAIAALRLTV